MLIIEQFQNIHSLFHFTKLMSVNMKCCIFSNQHIENVWLTCIISKGLFWSLRICNRSFYYIKRKSNECYNKYNHMFQMLHRLRKNRMTVLFAGWTSYLGHFRYKMYDRDRDIGNEETISFILPGSRLIWMCLLLTPLPHVRGQTINTRNAFHH